MKIKRYRKPTAAGLFKLARALRIYQEMGKCQVCRKPYEHAHHIDCDLQNNNPLNIMILCEKCHYRIHTQLRRPRAVHYGIYIMSEYAKFAGVAVQSIQNYFKKQKQEKSTTRKIDKMLLKLYL